MVARLVRDQKAAGSNPVTSTISSIHKGFNFMNTRFFVTVLCTEQAFTVRNFICVLAREMMKNEDTKRQLYKERANITFDELLASKMRQKI